MMRTLLCRTAGRLAILAVALGLAGGASAQKAPVALRGPDGGEVRALIIGIDAYRHVRPLKGAVNDARDIDSALRKSGVQDVTTMVDAEVDRNSVLREIDRLIGRSRAGDLVVLALAGHGAQEPEKVKGSQPDGMDNIFLLPGFEVAGAGTQQRVIGTEFNALIKKIEARGAKVLFVADTCHGGGMAREIDPRAEEMSFRQVPRYRIAVDELKPIATASEAFLSELDFEKTAFLAAVDRKTKSPEVRIPGVAGYRGALSYAMARAFEGQADADDDGKVTLKELFNNVRQVVYQLSDQRQNPVTLNSPNRDLDTDLAFLTRGVTVVSAPGAPSPPAQLPPMSGPSQRPSAPETGERPVVADANQQAPAQEPRPRPAAATAVRIASLDGKKDVLQNLTMLEAPFEVVAPAEQPDLVWDPKTGDVIVGGDVVAYRMDKTDLPSVIDRTAAVRGFKQLVARLPQAMKVVPDDKLHRNESRVGVEIADVAGRALILFNIAGDGTVQALYPIGSDTPIMRNTEHRLPVSVREPFGADQVVAVTADKRMPALEQALRQLNQRRTAVQMLRMVERHAPAGARIGSVGLFTAH